MHAIDNPAISALTCTPDYLGSLLEPTEKSFNDLEEAYNNYMLDLTELSKATREVTQATANVVATAKSYNHLVEENEDLDMSNLSLHQAKRLEMEAQVRILELGQALETERLRLAALRR
ncbi:PREDICTED: huntingtin-interacting protein 1-related protein-like [Cyphomyrmex costatus]|uniref:huntingtin-interacting protein 1-related protein-like n=1 Tax=Cyphomyrmex costatus TaxID=456900 RepID=UPI0008523520|nr:PREDICTED: huntingtin-interacting protein 1-related protein-like [Cyphomyrmex costatus]